MNKYYLLHQEYCGDGCGIPLLCLHAHHFPTRSKDDLWYPHQLFWLDNTPIVHYTDRLGPCVHCLTPFVKLPEFFITEEEYRDRHAEWEAIHPHYQEFKHFPLESGRYEGDGLAYRYLCMEKPFTKLRIKQWWPRSGPFSHWIWRHYFDTPRTEYTVSQEENSGEIYEWQSFSALGGVEV